MRPFAGLLSLFAACLLTVSVAQAAQQDFELHNKTGYQIDEVYVSQSAEQNWGEDVMGSQSLEDGNVVNITFKHAGSACRWDMHVKYNDGDEATWNSLNLCNISKVTLFWDKRRQTTRAVTE